MAESVNYILSEDQTTAQFMTAVLNSTLMHFWFKFGAEKTHGEQLQIDVEILETVPIHIPEEPVKKELGEHGQWLSLLTNAEKQYLKLWNEWSTKLRNGDISLATALTNDKRNITTREGTGTWTRNVSFYPDDDLKKEQIEYLNQEYDYFEMSCNENILNIHGIKERKELVFQMQFDNKNLMEHIILSIHTALKSMMRLKSLNELLSKTLIPVVKPDIVKNTLSIIETVHKEFLEYIKAQTTLLSIPTNIVDLWEKKENTRALIDARVFQIYEFSYKQAKEIMDSLNVPSHYMQKVLNCFE
jgi:hypothetical protein